MDLQLIKTFQEVAETGSFGAAAGRLFVTQSAVSLRVLRLEDELGCSLFDRNKGGTVLTAAGREFRGHATLILRNWEQARQKVSAVNDTATALSMAAEPSFWPSIGFHWLGRLREELPCVILRTEISRCEALAKLIMAGDVQVILTHEPLLRPGLASERLMEDQLVMVSPREGATVNSVTGQYAMIDWGTEFQRAHDEALPMLANAKLVLGTGTLAACYLRDSQYAAYLPARDVRQSLNDGTLFLVKGAPKYAYTCWVIWRDDLNPALRAVAEKTLTEAVQKANFDTERVIEQLHSGADVGVRPHK